MAGAVGAVADHTARTFAGGTKSLYNVLAELDGGVTGIGGKLTIYADKDATGMTGTLNHGSTDYRFVYLPPRDDAIYGEVRIDGKRHVFSHNNFAELRRFLKTHYDG